jgi:hypothetical protein
LQEKEHQRIGSELSILNIVCEGLERGEGGPGEEGLRRI